MEKEELKNAKYLGGIGAILSVFGVIPWIGWLLVLGGMILLLIAIKKIADITKEKSIFKDYLRGFIFGSIATFLFFVFLGIGVFLLFKEKTTTRFIPTMFIYLIVVACCISYGYFIKRSFTKIAEHTKEDIFKLTGKIFYISGYLTIIFIGFFGFFIGEILEAVAFFSLPSKLSEA